MRLLERQYQWEQIEGNVFDVAIVGGGINGASLYHHLCRRGYSVLLLEKGDFAGGTSQASAMMIWGGLLYLRHGDLQTVRRLCTSRDRMLREMDEWIKPQRFRYVPDNGAGPHRHLVHAALQLYWLIGGCKGIRPRRQRRFPEYAMLAADFARQSLLYEEACVEPSDARFVLQWLLPFADDARVAINYCSMEDGTYDDAANLWHLGLRDSILPQAGCARARWVINTAGVWTDRINKRMGMRSPYKHALSKGVFIAVKRDRRQRVPLIFPIRNGADAMSLIPWGPVSLWGPTETYVDTIEDGYTANAEDIRTLLAELNLRLASPVSPKDIISLRCGIRPLAVHRTFNGTRSSRDLSRRHRVHRDERLPWISVYGGKFTDCVSLAKAVGQLLRGVLVPSRDAVGGNDIHPNTSETVAYPGLHEAIPSASRCAKQERCWTLEDYLRRRTNIAQWVPRGGLGAQSEHVPHLQSVARAFYDGDVRASREAVERYEQKIIATFDQAIAAC